MKTLNFWFNLFLDAIASLEVGYVRVSVRCHQFCNHLSKTDKFWRFQTDEQQTTNRWPIEDEQQNMSNRRWPVKDNWQKMTNRRWPIKDDPQKTTYRRWPITNRWPLDDQQNTNKRQHLHADPIASIDFWSCYCCTWILNDNIFDLFYNISLYRPIQTSSVCTRLI